MPWRLIGFIVLFVVFLFFIVFNLGNSCDISFGFKVLPQVPVYLTAFSSFVLGMLWSIPYIVSFRTKKSRELTEGKKEEKKARKKWGKQKHGVPEDTPENEAPLKDSEFSGDKGPYGIN
jgi:uncharacterized integral membrane protein